MDAGSQKDRPHLVLADGGWLLIAAGGILIRYDIHSP